MSEKPSMEEQFAELLVYEREVLEKSGYNSHWLKRMLENRSRHSPKMRCWLFREICKSSGDYYREGTEMARDAGKNEQKEEKAIWRFVNIQLSDDEREAAKLEYKETDALWDVLVQVLRDGYKVTLSYDAETDSYCGALSGTNCGKPNQNLTLTAWGDNEVDALAYALYKHVTKLEFVWEQPGMKAKRLG